MATKTMEVRTIHDFIASRADFAVERRAFNEVIDELNDGFGDGARMKFVALGSEHTLAPAAPRSQSEKTLAAEAHQCS